MEEPPKKGMLERTEEPLGEVAGGVLGGVVFSCDDVELSRRCRWWCRWCCTRLERCCCRWMLLCLFLPFIPRAGDDVEVVAPGDAIEVLVVEDVTSVRRGLASDSRHMNGWSLWRYRHKGQTISFPMLKAIEMQDK